MKLSDLYKSKNCPSRATAYWCDGKRCVKFTSCMVDEIDALYAAGGITMEEADALDKELARMANPNNDGT